MDSSLLAAMASAGDESPGGDGTMNGDGLRAPLGTPMSLREDGAHASLTAPHSGAQQMVLGASPRAAATSLYALVLHEAYGTGTALGGGLLRNAATCRGSSSHIHMACVGLKAEDEETGAQAPASACMHRRPTAPATRATAHPTAAETVEDPKRALVHAMQNDLSRMSLLLERLDELLSA